jgi:hypothetical protein
MEVFVESFKQNMTNQSFAKMLDKNQVINEGILDTVRNNIRTSIEFISNKIKGAFAELAFGQKTSISLNYATRGTRLNEAVDKVDLKSRMGYYSEFCTAYAVAKLIDKEKGSMRGLKVSQLKKVREDYKKNKLLNVDFGADTKKVPAEAKRMEDSGIALAESIWNDIRLNATDLQIVDFEVKLTGELGKGITKADIELFAYKKNTKEVIDHIEASLKAYKGWNINVSNSTFVSWLINLLAPDIGGFTTKSSVEEKVTKFIKRYGFEKEMRRIQELQKFGPNIKKDLGRPVAKQAVDDELVYIQVRNLMIDIFEKQYKKRKEEINANFLTLLGFDGADDLYLGIQTKANDEVAVFSSRTSTGFKNILTQLQSNFSIEFERNDKIVNTPIIFKSGKNVLFKSNFAFRDLDKVSMFVSFKDWQ